MPEWAVLCCFGVYMLNVADEMVVTGQTIQLYNYSQHYMIVMAICKHWTEPVHSPWTGLYMDWLSEQFWIPVHALWTGILAS